MALHIIANISKSKRTINETSWQGYRVKDFVYEKCPENVAIKDCPSMMGYDDTT